MARLSLRAEARERGVTVYQVRKERAIEKGYSGYTEEEKQHTTIATLLQEEGLTRGTKEYRTIYNRLVKAGDELAGQRKAGKVEGIADKEQLYAMMRPYLSDESMRKVMGGSFKEFY